LRQSAKARTPAANPLNLALLNKSLLTHGRIGSNFAHTALVVAMVLNTGHGWLFFWRSEPTSARIAKQIALGNFMAFNAT
jgi:hypothetical protein